MGRHAKFSCEVGAGVRVPYSPKARGGLFRAVFPSPAGGGYAEAATGVAVPKGWSPKRSPPPQFHPEAERVVRAAYARAAGAGAVVGAGADWDEAERTLLDGVAREGTRRTYRSTLRLVRAASPGLAGPGQVAAADAAAFTHAYRTGGYRRARAADGVVRPRSAQTVSSTVKTLSIVWNRLLKAGAVSANVWVGVERPRVPRRLPVVPTDDAIDSLFAWLDRRYPGPDGRGWELVKTFVRLKMVSGCRLNDLCQVWSWQLEPAAGTLRILADQDKTHRERLLTLPPPLVRTLDRLKGPTYLWERYSADRVVFRPKGAATAFTPAVMYNAVQSIFRDYNRQNPLKRLRSHDLRRRAITETVIATGGNFEAAAQAIPVTSDTARRYYFDAKHAVDAAEIQRRTAGVLLGRWAGGEGEAGE